MSKRIVKSNHAPEPIGPYSQAVLTGEMLFVSGQIAIDQTTGALITNSIEAETEQVLKNIGYILEEAGMNYTHVVKCSIFLTDMAMFPRVNAVYGKFFAEIPPARETVQVSRLPKDVSVEISCIAVL